MTEALACPWCGARINEWCVDVNHNHRPPHLVRKMYTASVRFLKGWWYNVTR